MSARRGGRKAKPLGERFWAKVEKSEPDQCWLWRGAKDNDGYGFIKRSDGAQLRAHRVSFELSFGCIPRGAFICHRCDTPSCVNPAHLFIGDALLNNRDKMRKGRFIGSRGEGNGSAKLSECQVRAIRLDHRPLKPIASQYGVSISTIGQIRRGVIWQE